MPQVSNQAATVIHAMRGVKTSKIIVPYLWGAGHSWEVARTGSLPEKSDCSAYQMWSMVQGGYEQMMLRLGMDPARTSSAEMYRLLKHEGLALDSGQVARWKRGCLVFLYVASLGRIGHVGLTIAPDYVVHCSKGAGGVNIAKFAVCAWTHAAQLP